MDAERLKALFEPFAAVAAKRMFGGAGVYAEGLCFAIEQGGDSSPFVYVASGKPMPTSFWRLPAIAHEQNDELIRWASLGLEAARRVAKAKPKANRKRTIAPAKGRKKSK